MRKRLLQLGRGRTSGRIKRSIINDEFDALFMLCEHLLIKSL
jgi:hypothetical protein